MALNSALSALLLCENGIGVAGAAALSEEQHEAYLSLSLNYNQFGDAGVAALSEALSEALKAGNMTKSSSPRPDYCSNTLVAACRAT
jgi:hypothetical protein